MHIRSAYFRDPSWNDSAASKIVGHLLSSFVLASFYGHGIQVVGQLLAVASPFTYMRLMTHRNTLLLIGIGWLVPLLECVPAYVGKRNRMRRSSTLMDIADGCDLRYESSVYMWTRDTTTVCGPTMDAFEMYQSFAILGFMLVCTAVTFVMVRCYRSSWDLCVEPA